MRKALAAVLGAGLIGTGLVAFAAPASANCWAVDLDGRCVNPCLVAATVYYTVTGDHADCPA